MKGLFLAAMLMLVVLAMSAEPLFSRERPVIQREVAAMDGQPGLELGLISPTYPSGRPPGASEVMLGKDLFFDVSLSVDRRVSCASCHDRAQGFSDGRAVSRGVGGREGTRNSPTLWNVAFLESLSWDGRNRSLEEQALAAISNPKEMGLDLSQVKTRVEEKYGLRMREIYGESSAENVAKALAAFQRTLIAGDSPFDRYIYGKQNGAISEAAKRGFKIFIGSARCVECHTIRCEECHPFGGSTALFTDGRFHNIGVGFNKDGTPSDRGRASVTDRPEDEGAFRTPTLRNVELTAPYMHDGSKTTLREVIDFYNDGGVKNSNLDPEIHSLDLGDREKEDLEAFLKSLTSVKLQKPSAQGQSRHLLKR